MTMSWHMMVNFEPPLIAECMANLECTVTDTSLVGRYDLFILEVVKAWADAKQKNPKTSTIMATARSWRTAARSS